MFDLIQFGAGVVVGVLACYLVVRNQLAKNESLQAYKAELEAKLRDATDLVWDEVSEQKAKLSEIIGRLK